MKFPFPRLTAAILLALRASTVLHAQAVPPPSSNQSEPVTLSAFEISAEGDRGYLSTSSAAASRIGAQLKDITQTISVINQELLDDLAPNDLNDMLRYASTVDIAEGAGETFQIRGNDAGVPLLNGFRVPRKFPADPADVERVEVLAGPASVLYGNVFGIGGVINRVSKRPLFKRQHSVQLRYSTNEENYRGVLDTTGAFGQSKNLAYRVIFAAQNGDLEKDFSYLERYTLLPKVLYKLGPKTTFIVEGDFSRQKTSRGVNLGLNYDYILYRTAAGALVAANAPTTAGVANTAVIIDVPDRVNPEADLVRGDFRNRGANFTLTSELSRHWSMRTAAMAVWADQVWNIPGVAGQILTDARRINRARLQERRRGVGNYFLQADAAGKYDWEKARLLLVGGAEYSVDVTTNRFKQAATALPAFDFFNPDYSIPFPATLVPTTRDDTRVFQWAGFAMGQVSLLKDRVMLNAGARVIDFRQVVRTHLSNGPNKFHGEATSIPKWGAIVRVTDDIGFYYGHGESYQPSTQVNPDGQILPPNQGVQDEVGVKLSLLGGRVSGTIAAFDLRQVNILETDPNRPTFAVPTGERSTKGYDVALTLSPTDYWQIIAGYSHAESETTSSVAAVNIGLARTGVPDYRWKLWTRYRFPQSALKGLAIGAGTHYVDFRSIRFATGSTVALTLPSYRLYDAMLSYHWQRKVTAQLNVQNLADEKYYPNGNANRFTVGQPRVISVSLGYRF